MRIIVKFLLVILLALAVFANVWYVNHEKTRPERLDLAACRDNMICVRDGLLLYEKTKGLLPDSLADLVPCYVSEHMMYCRQCWKNMIIPKLDNKYLYSYDPKARLLADPVPHEMHGLISRKAAIQSIPIPTQMVSSSSDPAPEIVKPPDQSIIIEAEMFSSLNYGWEIKNDPMTGNGAFIMNKEGVANNTAIINGSGDFYNVGQNREMPRLVYKFKIPKAGIWHIRSRIMTGATHCSNKLEFFIDENNAGTFGDDNIAPFKWFWDAPKAIYLSEGPHELRIYPWEDGLNIDQFAFSFVNWKEEKDTAPVFKSTTMPDSMDKSLFIIHDLDTCILDPDRPPDINVWLRQTTGLSGWASLKTTILLPDGEKELMARKFTLGENNSLICFPVKLDGIDFKNLPRREYLLKSTLTVNNESKCVTTTALLKPFQWQITEMLPFMSPEVFFSSDNEHADTASLTNGREYAWQPFETKWYDPFGVMDFGVMFVTNTLHAPAYHTICAKTQFRCLRDDEYQFKLLSDDQMTVFLDGKLIDKSYTKNCAIRTARRKMIHLTIGEHVILYRLNQYSDRWQAGIFIRSRDDQISPWIKGLD